MKTVIREIVQVVILAMLIFVVARAVVQNHIVEGSSMEPSVHTGQLILVGRVAYLFSPPHRGDVIVFHFPGDPSRDFIKRVIGLPGETVEVKGGVTYVSGDPLQEPYLAVKMVSDFPGTWVPPDHYFVMGDNRNVSYDSRAWGLLPRENIVGQAWLCLWPIDRWGLAPNYSFTAAGQEAK